MPNYDYKCTSCPTKTVIAHRMTDTSTHLCPDCSSPLKRALSINKIAMNGDVLDSPAKIMKETAYQRKEKAELKLRQVDRYGTSGGLSLKPNFNGQEVASWEEAKQLASESGADTKTYERVINTESRVNKDSNLDESIWKKAKETAFRS